jgi:branched-subunit amino acid aminotransferase/4-amino-4-deoxychorismate lyase
VTLAIAVSGRGLVDPREPVIHVDDEAFMRGRGAFETLRVYEGRPFLLEQHLDRLEGSCARLGFAPVQRPELVELAILALEAAGAPDATLRFYATPGREGPVAVAVVAALPDDLERQRADGIRLISVEFRPTDLIGGVKSTSYALNMVAVDAARAAGADDAVFLGDGRVVLEATTSNVWWRIGEKLRTPAADLGILPGVTRSVLLTAAQAEGYRVEEGDFDVDDLAGSDEAFTTSSVREVMPVVALDGAAIGDGKPDAAAAALQAALRKLACP